MASLRNVPALVIVAMLGAAPFIGPAGCGRTACFEYTQAEYVANGNSCPAQKDALPNFTSASCVGPVVAVDGAGSFDGQLCCYPVTEDDIEPECGTSGGTETDTDGTFTETGFPDTGFDTEDTGATAEEIGCSTCSSIVSTGPASCTVDGSAQKALGDLSACVSAQCQAVCGDFLDGTASLDAAPGCSPCASQRCAEELESCEAT